MSVLTRHLSRMFLTRFVLVIAGFAALGTILDLFANLQDVLAAPPGGLIALLHYSILRLPELVAPVLPLSALIGSLLVFATLMRSQELVALRAGGVSQFGQMRMVLPVALLAALLHFTIDNVLLPGSNASLRAWGVAEYEPADDAVVWIREGDTILRWRRIEADTLFGITLFRHDENGQLVERIDAASARYAGDRWRLHDARRLRVAAERMEQVPLLIWRAALDPRAVVQLAAPPAKLSLVTLGRLVTGGQYGNRPPYFYRTWLLQRVAAPAGTLLLCLFAVPLTQRFQRTAGVGSMLAIGVVLGFLYLIFFGVTLTLGEAGVLPPMLAAWTPPLLLALATGIFVFRFERY